MRALIKEATYKNYKYRILFFNEDFGELNEYLQTEWFTGYVKIPKGHKLYKKDCEDLDFINCHGGITFADFLDDGPDWYIGLDCRHYGDSAVIQDAGYVEKECKSIIDQIIAGKDQKKMTKTDKHMEICKLLNDIYKAKNEDYGNSFTETFEKFGIISAVTRIADKTNRLMNLSIVQDIKIKDESIEDTLMDLANYAIMTLIELKRSK